MNEYFLEGVARLFVFLRQSYGTIHSPYITFRKLAVEKKLTSLLFILFFTLLYFAFTSLIRIGIESPFFLTLAFNRLCFFALLTYLLSVGLLYGLGRILKGEDNLRGVLLCWGYSLLPTLGWFFVTSIIYLFVPPPRTFSLPGKFLSFIFIMFSLVMLYWKGILYYLTLRFALKLDLMRILLITMVFLPIVCLYSVLLYRLEVFRIPFL